MINNYFVWLISHYSLSTLKPLTEFKKQSYHSLFHIFSMLFSKMFYSPILLTFFNFWIALIQTGEADSLYMCFLISIELVPCLKYSERTKWTLWLNYCKVSAVICKGTLCFLNWKDRVSSGHREKWTTQNNQSETWMLKNLHILYYQLQTLHGGLKQFSSQLRPNYSDTKYPVIIRNEKTEFFRLHFILGLQISLSQWQDTGWHFPLKFIRASFWKC